MQFSFQPDGPRPQNTGASAIDHDVDIVIGRSADAQHKAFQKRQEYKKRVIAAHNTSGQYLSRLDNGEYFVMSEEERAAAKRGRMVNQEAMARIKEYKDAKRANEKEGSRKGDG